MLKMPDKGPLIQDVNSWNIMHGLSGTLFCATKLQLASANYWYGLN